MEFLDSITGFLAGINFKLIFQLTCLALIVISECYGDLSPIDSGWGSVIQ